MDVSIDSDGDLLCRGDVRYFLSLNEEKDLIQLRACFTFEAETAELQKFQAVNQINRKYVIVKAVILDSDSLGFEWDLPLSGGITKKLLCSPSNASAEFRVLPSMMLPMTLSPDQSAVT